MTKQESIQPVTAAQGIAAALAKAQTEMGKALKQATNPHFRNKYADLGNVMDACLPALNSNGIAVVQPIGQDDLGMFVQTVLAHTSGERLECRVPLIIGKNDMQGYGSAVTYARRYGLMSMAGIAPEDDDGNAAAAAAPRRQEPRQADDQLEAMETFGHAVSAAVGAIDGQATHASLGAYWTALNANQKAVAADARVIAAKDKRKAALTAASVNDDIPYEGAK